MGCVFLLAQDTLCLPSIYLRLDWSGLGYCYYLCPPLVWRTCLFWEPSWLGRQNFVLLGALSSLFSSDFDFRLHYGLFLEDICKRKRPMQIIRNQIKCWAGGVHFGFLFSVWTFNSVFDLIALHFSKLFEV